MLSTHLLPLCWSPRLLLFAEAREAVLRPATDLPSNVLRPSNDLPAADGAKRTPLHAAKDHVRAGSGALHGTSVRVVTI